EPREKEKEKEKEKEEEEESNGGEEIMYQSKKTLEEGNPIKAKKSVIAKKQPVVFSVETSLVTKHHASAHASSHPSPQPHDNDKIGWNGRSSPQSQFKQRTGAMNTTSITPLPNLTKVMVATKHSRRKRSKTVANHQKDNPLHLSINRDLKHLKNTFALNQPHPVPAFVPLVQSNDPKESLSQSPQHKQHKTSCFFILSLFSCFCACLYINK
ncbi:hypothetical protein RFI_18042, partial [Reticulomyxa filosa]